MGDHSGPQNVCGCRTMHDPTFSIASGSRRSLRKIKEDAKCFQEIGAEIIGNQLIIRVEKDKNKSVKRRNGEWDPPCDCEIPEIRMPTTTEDAKIMNAGDNNQILFRIRSRCLVGKDDANYKPEAFAYQLGSGKKGRDANDQHRTITVHPNLSDSTGSQEVHSDHITNGNQNIYLLRIKKKSDDRIQRKRNIELELRTPKQTTPRQEPKFLQRKSESPKLSQPEIEMKVETINDVEKAVKKKEKKRKKK